MNDPELVLRQVLVAEIGQAGQTRIAASTASLEGEGLELEVATRYARGAGFAEVEARPRTEARELDEVEASLGSHAARDVLLGARAALRAIREAVGLAGSASRAPSRPAG